MQVPEAGRGASDYPTESAPHQSPQRDAHEQPQAEPTEYIRYAAASLSVGRARSVSPTRLRRSATPARAKTSPLLSPVIGSSAGGRQGPYILAGTIGDRN